MRQTTQGRAASGNAAGDNPYLDARRAWNDHVGHLVAARALWQVVALVSLMLAATAVGIVAHIATRSKFVPYVVEVDHAGNVEAIKRATAMAPASRAVIEARLETFITLTRRVTMDIALQRAAVKGVFAMLAVGDPATTKMEAHFMGEGHPVKRAEDVTVATEISAILPQTADTWQVDWVESVYNRDGELRERFSMRAHLEVYQSQPAGTSEDALKANPLSVYIRDFNWARRQEREVKQ